MIGQHSILAYYFQVRGSVFLQITKVNDDHSQRQATTSLTTTQESQTTSFTTPTTDTDGRCTQEWPPMPGTGSAIKEGRNDDRNVLPCSIRALSDAIEGVVIKHFTRGKSASSSNFYLTADTGLIVSWV